MSQPILQDLSPKERLEVLKTNCETAEEFIYSKQLPPDEIDDLTTKVVRGAIKLAQLDEAKKAYMEGWKISQKPVKEEYMVALAEVRAGAREVTETVYLMADHDEKVMNYYNADGECVFVRPLRMNEYQLRIIPEAGNNQ